MARICIELLYMEAVWPIAPSLIQQLERYRRLDDFLEKDNYVQSLLVYSAEHWPSHLQESCLSKYDSAVSQILPFYQANSKLFRL